MKTKLFLLIFCSALVYSCFQTNNEKQSKESSGTTGSGSMSDGEIKNRGAEITMKMQETLSGKLKAAIEDSGVTYALQFCNLKAYPLTDSISNHYGVKIKRVSHRARNAANNAGESELKMISAYKSALSNGESLAPLVEEAEQHYTYYAPIILSSPLCLKCHGEPGKDIAAEDFITINLLYPGDKATGFALNDLRGMWRIDFEKKWVQ